MAKTQAARVKLSTGKEVILRQLKISDTELAAQEVAPRANGDGNVLQILMQKALIKLLILQVNGQDLTAAEREDLDSLFSIAEYTQLLTVVKKMSGGDDLGKDCQIEVVSFGDK